MKNKPSLEEQLRRAVVEKMWLNYFNDSLLAQGIITPKDHQRMQAQIIQRKPLGERYQVY